MATKLAGRLTVANENTLGFIAQKNGIMFAK